MPRTVKEEDYTTRRNEIVDAAQALLYTRGFEQMSIQEILDAMHISKGAFYHYFHSKADLLEAIINRIEVEGDRVIRPIVEDPRLSALEKLELFFAAANRWKTGQLELMQALLRAWYMDENVMVRQKSTAAGLRWMGPLFTNLIEQGRCEGVFHIPDAAQASPVVLTLLVGMSDALAVLLLSGELSEEMAGRLEQTAQGYTTAIERVLGAAPGSLHLMDREMFRPWVQPEHKM